MSDPNYTYDQYLKDIGAEHQEVLANYYIDEIEQALRDNGIKNAEEVTDYLIDNFSEEIEIDAFDGLNLKPVLHRAEVFDNFLIEIKWKLLYLRAWQKVNDLVDYWESTKEFLPSYSIDQKIRYENLRDYLKNRIENVYA